MLKNKLLLFGGKGGVGKTSCAAATAIYASKNDKKTLILSTDPAHSLSDSFDIQIGSKITKINNNLDALEIDAELLLKEYKEKNGEMIKQIADEGTFFSKEDIQQFFNLSLPGMDELMSLIKIIDILGENKYDIIILDTAPTGHTIRLLEMPDLMTAYVNVLTAMKQKHRVIVSMMVGRYVKDKEDLFIEKMKTDIDRIKTILKDSSKTRFIPVTIPEALSVFETEKLIKVLEKHQISIDKVLINNVITDNCDFCKSKYNEQLKYINKIKKNFSKYEIMEIPLFPNELRGETLEILSKILFHEKYNLPEPTKKTNNENINFDSLKINPGMKFLLIGGKGGVGKTVIASSIALEESKKKKVLIFSTDPAHSLSDSFNIQIGNKITKINNNLDALEIDSYNLLNKLKLQYKKEIQSFFKSVFKSKGNATIDAPYDRRVMESLFDLAPPGIDEIMSLKTIMDLMQDNKYDLFILDTAPTGHAIRLLELPETAVSWVSTLLDIQEKYPISFDIGDTLLEMLNTIKKISTILKDSKKTEFIAVSIPETMSLLETQDLISNLIKLKIPIESLIINKIYPESKCSFCKSKRSEQFNFINKFKDLKLKTMGIKLFDSEINGLEKLNKLSSELYVK